MTTTSQTWQKANVMKRKLYQIFVEVSVAAIGTGAWGLALVSDDGDLLSEYIGGAKDVVNYKTLLDAAVSAVIELSSPHTKCDFYVFSSINGAEEVFRSKQSPAHIYVSKVAYEKDSWADYAVMLARVGVQLLDKKLISHWGRTKIKTSDILELANGKVERTDGLPRSVQHNILQRGQKEGF